MPGAKQTQISATKKVLGTLEGLSFMLLVKLKVHVTASFSAALRDMTSVSAARQHGGRRRAALRQVR